MWRKNKYVNTWEGKDRMRETMKERDRENERMAGRGRETVQHQTGTGT